MSEIWSVVTIAGLAGWLTSTMIFLFKAFPERDRFEKRPAMIWGISLIISFAIWIAGLLNA